MCGIAGFLVSEPSSSTDEMRHTASRVAGSLEGSIPHLDPRVAGSACLPLLSMRVRWLEGMWILCQLLFRYVPREMVDRPKSGFGFALDAWLSGGSLDWAEDLFGENRIRREGLCHPEPIRQRWKEHPPGRRNWAFLPWDALMSQARLEDSRRTPASESPASPVAIQWRVAA
jgi:asparagine synthase (glutamine-hydrolysing)